jgi:hypothetical protein
MGELVGASPTNEQNVTARNVFNAPKALDNERSAADRFSLHNIVDNLPEGIVAEDADDERRLVIDKRAWRPLHELRKIEEKDRLDVRRLQAERLAGNGWSPAQRRDRQQDGGRHRRASAPIGALCRPGLDAVTVPIAVTLPRARRLSGDAPR